MKPMRLLTLLLLVLAGCADSNDKYLDGGISAIQIDETVISPDKTVLMQGRLQHSADFVRDIRLRSDKATSTGRNFGTFEISTSVENLARQPEICESETVTLDVYLGAKDEPEKYLVDTRIRLGTKLSLSINGVQSSDQVMPLPATILSSILVSTIADDAAVGTLIEVTATGVGFKDGMFSTIAPALDQAIPDQAGMMVSIPVQRLPDANLPSLATIRAADTLRCNSSSQDVAFLGPPLILTQSNVGGGTIVVKPSSLPSQAEDESIQLGLDHCFLLFPDIISVTSDETTVSSGEPWRETNEGRFVFDISIEEGETGTVSIRCHDVVGQVSETEVLVGQLLVVE